MHNAGIKSPKSIVKRSYIISQKESEGMMLQAERTLFDWFIHQDKYKNTLRIFVYLISGKQGFIAPAEDNNEL